ncbi:hypothetical protein B0T12DRAFT_464268 [Alternaria alternata]|nr:hypothetical protein B0T12DRAFT_464268 [Alternaria alternata]
MANEQDYIGRQGALRTDTPQNMSNISPPLMTAEDEIVGDLDEPPEPRAQRPAPLALRHSSTTSFTKSKPLFDRKESLLTSALKSGSNASSPVEEHSDASPVRGMSCVSTWSNNSAFHNMLPTFNKKPLELPVSVVSHDDENVTPVPKTVPQSTEQSIEAVLGRKRCIMFACGPKEDKKPVEAPAKPAPAPATQTGEPPKRVCTIKFACPSKPSTEASSKPRRMASPAPPPRRIPSSPKPATKVHRDSDSTVRNNSPVSVRKVRPVDRTRRLSSNSDLARCEAYRFHEFASSEEEVEEWTQEVTCHRSRLTVQDTLKIENNLRKLGEEVAEEEAIDEEDEDEDEDGDNVEMDDDDDDLLDEDADGSDAYSDATDEGFQTDDENGFAVSDDEDDAGSDYDWWAPGASTAATSVEHLEHLRLKTHRTVSESSIGSLESREGLKIMDKPSKRRKSKPVNIRVPSPELPDSTDFVCGTLDEDRPAEAAYMSTLERRRAAKHKPTPQDIDPTFPTSDPELPDDDEDEVSENEKVSESDHLMIHGRMDPVNIDGRGRQHISKKRSPLPSPKRLRSPPPAKRAVHRSPPPRKLFGNSPKRLQSPPPPMRLRSPPPTRRGSVNPVTTRQRSDTSIRFAGIAERPAPTVSASVPRTPITMRNPFDLEDDEDADASDMPIRRAIDIKVGLEKKRQRRKEKLYRKQHRKGAKEKRPAPGRGAERMREMGLAVHAHKGKTTVFQPFRICPEADEDMHVLSA